MSITENKKAFFDYFIEERFEAGLVLEGWEVKAIRAGKVQIREAYVRVVRQQIQLIGATITALQTASTHVNPDATRSRVCLLHKAEIARLIGRVEQKGYTLVPLNLHYKGGRVKLEIGLAKGKKTHDKREAVKEREAKIEQQRAMRTGKKYE